MFRKEVGGGAHSSSGPIHDTGRGSLSELTESPATDEPPLIENPFVSINMDTHTHASILSEQLEIGKCINNTS